MAGSVMHQLATSIEFAGGVQEVKASETLLPSLQPQALQNGQPNLSVKSLWTDACFTDMSGPYMIGVDLLQQHLEPSHHKDRSRSAAFVASLRDCARNRDLDRGSQLHDDIAKLGLIERCSDALIAMYAKCGAIDKAKMLLASNKSKNVASWTAIIAGLIRQGKGREAIDCFEQMQYEGISPDAVTFACLLRACAAIKAVDKGSLIHKQLASEGLLANDTLLANALVDMYAKCGELTKAKNVFDEIPSKDVISWNTLLAGYTQHGQGGKALRCFEMMKRERLCPDEVTYACVLKACSLLKAVDRGVEIHNLIARQGLLKCNPVLGSALVDMYAKCGNLGMAQQVLEELAFNDVVLWNSLIGGYAKQGLDTEALKCFTAMKRKGISPDSVTFTCVLKACGALGAIDVGQKIHDDITKEALLKNNVILGTALVDMYAKCGSLTKAKEVLEELQSRSVVSWSALIAGYTQHGEGERAFSCFEQMQLEGIAPDSVTFICVLKACGIMKAIDKGNHIYNQVLQLGLLNSDIMIGTVVVDMYVKCDALSKARKVLYALPRRNVVSWNTLIAGFGEQGQGKEALDCFEQMQRERIDPDAVTFSCILKVCGNMKLLDKGEQIHKEIVRQKMLESDVVLGTALVDMYVKCANLEKARKALEMLPSRNVVTWNALLVGYVQQGQVEEALRAFEQMQLEGISPDATTLSCVLSSCSHLGLLEDGHVYFTSMTTKHRLKPQLEHYSCMVDLYGRAGQLEKAVKMIQDMPFTEDSSIMSGLLGACQKWGDVKVANWAFEKALQVDRSEGGAYVLMANLHTGTENAPGAEKSLKTKVDK